MSFDYKNNVVVFSGKVHAVQADSELTSNTLHVLMNKQSQIQTMIADGNVRMSQGTRWATGDHAVLDENIHTLVLTGSPVVHDGKDQIAGTEDYGLSADQQERSDRSESGDLPSRVEKTE